MTSRRSSADATKEAGKPLAPSGSLASLVRDVRACRRCVEAPDGAPLPHAPRPVLRVSPTARIAVCGQAPGTRVHQSGVPFTDPSGDRLREWMGVDLAEFYDDSRIAIVPMGFCFPGLDVKGGDLPPRRECAPLWRGKVLALLPRLELILLVGQYAHRWHLPRMARAGVGRVVREHRPEAAPDTGPRLFPLPHPSWRNNAWIGANPWFETDVLPRLRIEVRGLMD